MASLKWAGTRRLRWVSAEPARDQPQIEITEQGPYRVSGGVPLAGTSQVETEYGEPIDWAPLEPISAGRRYSLCRCGRSSSKPFCDDSHEQVEWEGTEVADRAPRDSRADLFPGDGVVMTDDHSFCTHAGYCGDRFVKVWDLIDRTSDPAIRERLKHMVDLCPSGTLDHRASIVAPADEPAFDKGIAVAADGPLWVRGGVTLRSADGSTYEIRNRVTLCRCGHSANKPFCDGTHKDIGFRDP